MIQGKNQATESRIRCVVGIQFSHVVMFLGGDFTQFNGRGGESIYGDKFADEKYVFCISMLLVQCRFDGLLF